MNVWRRPRSHSAACVGARLHAHTSAFGNFRTPIERTDTARDYESIVTYSGLAARLSDAGRGLLRAALSAEPEKLAASMSCC